MKRIRVALLLALLACLFGRGSLDAAPLYPVKVGPTGRYLVDQNGVLFMIAGESPQAMIGNLSLAEAEGQPSEVELFFINRQAHGFNTAVLADDRDDGGGEQ